MRKRAGSSPPESTASPIRDGTGAYVGAVVIGVKRSAISAQVNASVRAALLTGLLSFAATLGLIMLFITTQIGRPVQTLVVAANAVAAWCLMR